MDRGGGGRGLHGGKIQEAGRVAGEDGDKEEGRFRLQTHCRRPEVMVTGNSAQKVLALALSWLF